MEIARSLLAALILVATLMSVGGCTPAIGDNGEAQPGVTTPSEIDFDPPDEGEAVVEDANGG
ncbi:MAG: hypothetical protein NUV77_00655 [Thermoguttaceae bacterium]|jgi:hypothetical protein|nr:hypothetical protein [Thermoguttaceae bacterium]